MSTISHRKTDPPHNDEGLCPAVDGKSDIIIGTKRKLSNLFLAWFPRSLRHDGKRRAQAYGYGHMEINWVICVVKVGIIVGCFGYIFRFCSKAAIY